MAKIDDDFLGDWGRHLVKVYRLSPESAMELEQEAAELYSHDTADGWCCACDADKAFMYSTLEREGWSPPKLSNPQPKERKK